MKGKPAEQAENDQSQIFNDNISQASGTVTPGLKQVFNYQNDFQDSKLR